MNRLTVSSLQSFASCSDLSCINRFRSNAHATKFSILSPFSAAPMVTNRLVKSSRHDAFSCCFDGSQLPLMTGGGGRGGGEEGAGWWHNSPVVFTWTRVCDGNVPLVLKTGSISMRLLSWLTETEASINFCRFVNCQDSIISEISNK